MEDDDKLEMGYIFIFSDQVSMLSLIMTLCIVGGGVDGIVAAHFALKVQGWMDQD